jgi:hypothetical protein
VTASFARSVKVARARWQGRTVNAVHFSLDGAARLPQHPRPMKGHDNRGDAMVTVLIVLFAAVVLLASALG